MLPALLVNVAVLGGIGWAIGSVGKRYGVEAAEPANKLAACAALTVCYCAGGVFMCLFSLLTLTSSSVHTAFHDPAWRSRLLLCSSLGSVCTFACLASIHSFALARIPSNSAVTAMVMNSVYLVCCPIVLAIVFQGEIGAVVCVATILVLSGSLVLDPNCMIFGKGNAADTSPLVSSENAGNWQASSVCIAVVTGLGWCTGPLSKRYGVPDTVPDELKMAMSALTNVVISSVGFVFLSCWALGCLWGKFDVLRDGQLQRRMPIVLAAGGASGLGGLLCTYAMSLSSSSESPIIITISNATFNLVTPIAIALVYSERLSAVQSFGAILIVAGVALVIVP